MAAVRRGSDRRVVTGAEDGVAKVWWTAGPIPESPKDQQAPICEVTLSHGPDWEGHTAGITSVSYSPKGTGDLILTSSKDKTLKIWTPSNPQSPLHKTCPDLSKAKDVSHEEDAYRSAERQGTSQVGHQDYVNMATWCRAGLNRGRAVLSCSDDRSAILWDPKTGRQMCAMEGHSDAVATATYSKDGTRILTASHDISCMLWDPTRQEDQMLLRTFPGKQSSDRHHKEIWSARFGPDEGGNRIVTASKDSTCIIWATSSALSERVLKGHSDSVIDAVWNDKDSEQVLSCSFDGTAQLWDLRKKDACQVYSDHTSTVWSANFGSDPYLIITAGHDMIALVYDIRMTRAKQVLSGHTGILWQATFSPDDLWAVTCSEDGTARLWDLSTGDEFPRCYVLQDKNSRSASPVTCGDFHRRTYDS